MATHRPTTPPPHHPVPSREPVAVADTVKAIAAVAASLGWAFTDTVVAAVISLVTAAVFLWQSFWTRRVVTSPATLARRYTRLESGRLKNRDVDTGPDIAE